MKTAFLYTLALGFAGAVPIFGQFSSGSTGADGALNFTTPGTVVFDPAVLGLDPSGDNVFNFTTINIAAGVTVKLTATHVRSRPVIWLATGNVTIAGVLDLSGAAGPEVNSNSPWSTRGPSEPGPGGYPGGLAGVSSQGVTAAWTPGFGPGAEPTLAEAGAGYATGGTACDQNGPSLTVTGVIYGSATLTPLLGGSGGGGSVNFTNSGRTATSGGGAGGGAIRIISSTSIAINGSILARGGSGGTDANSIFSGSGSGGAIHLVAPAISGGGTIDASGGLNAGTGTPVVCAGGQGRILISTNANNFSGTQSGIGYSGHLALPPSTAGAASVNVTSINGVAVPANPGGSIAFPDITFASAGAVTVNIAASNVPVGTLVTLTLVPEIGSVITATCQALTGTVASSTSTCSATFPGGSSLVYAIASW